MALSRRPGVARLGGLAAAVLVVGSCRSDRAVAVSAVTTGGSADYASVRIEGLRRSSGEPPEGVAVYAVPAGDSLDAEAPRLAGRWLWRGSVLEFKPRFPPSRGLALWVRVDTAGIARPGREAPPLLKRFALDPVATETEPPAVVGIHPAVDSVPENLLRLYLEFSRPMLPGVALQHLRIRDERGREVERAFLDVSQELWSPNGRRLTVLFDPGRVKRGVRTNLESGRPLKAGHRYVLEIEPGWPDQTGVPLPAALRKTFQVVGEDVTGPDPSRWELAPPAIGSRDPLVIQFEDLVDHALASRLVAVFDEGGAALPGEATVDEGDRRWRFRPLERWLAGRYRVVVSPELEDVAGNRPGRPFDRAAGTPSAPQEPASIWFSARPADVARR